MADQGGRPARPGRTALQTPSESDQLATGQRCGVGNTLSEEDEVAEEAQEAEVGKEALIGCAR